MYSKFYSRVTRQSLLAVLAISFLSLTGCNGVGSRDTLLARIGSEKVYQEDYDLLVENDGVPSTKSKGEVLYSSLYSKAAIAERAVSEFPELEKDWDEYSKRINPRILMMVFQRFYVMECLMYSDADLQKFYYENKDLFSGDSTGEYLKVRAKVAKKLYLATHAKEANEYVNSMLGSDSTVSRGDSLALLDRFAEAYRQKLPGMISAEILQKQNVNIYSLPATDPKDYYARHADQFMTVPGYEVLQIQAKTAGALDSLIADTISLEGFKRIAAQFATDTLLQRDSGYVGVIKKGYALPHIGMVEGLSRELDGKNPGFVTRSMMGEDSLYHKFYLVGQVASKQKGYDRVEAYIAAAISNGEVYDVDSNFVLIAQEGKTLFTEGDLLKFNDEFIHAKLNVNNHNRLVRMMAETLAYADAAKKLKMDRKWEYRAIARMTRWDYICENYLSKKRGANLVPEDSLQSLYERIGSPIHVGYTYEKAIGDLRLVNGFPKNLYQHEYLFGYRLIYAGKSFDQSIASIYAKREKEYGDMFRQRIAAEAYAKLAVHMYDTDTPVYEPCMTSDDLLSKADSLIKEGKRTEAYYAYRRLMYAYADVDSLFERAAYEMAQIQADNEEFLDAEAEYYAFYRMWPKSANAEKAMFSRGFLLNENLGMNEESVKVLEEFLQTYPNSELKESAEWLVNNIKSHGKLADDLMKKITSEEN